MSYSYLPIWDLQDRLEAGTLAPAEAKAISTLINCVGALGDTDDPAKALAFWQLARETLKTALPKES